MCSFSSQVFNLTGYEDNTTCDITLHNKQLLDEVE